MGSAGMRTRLLVALGLGLTAAIGWDGLLYAQQEANARVALSAEPEPLVRGEVNDTQRITLRGNVHPLAQTGLDEGRVEDSFAVDRLYLLLQRTPAQEQALAQFLLEAHTPGSAGYHQWLTPEEFGVRFGPSDSDIAALTAWLESHGLTVNRVHPGRIAVEFSGNAAQVREAFHTEIHRFGLARSGLRSAQFANASDPQIPAAFASLVAAISPMHSFHAQPLVKVAGRTAYDTKTHEAQLVTGSSPRLNGIYPKRIFPDWTYPDWTYPVASNAVTYELSPADFAVQYDLNPVYAAGTTGAGQNIGIVSMSNIDLSLVQAYQSLFKLPANVPTVVVDGNDPGLTDSATEAYLDVELAGAVAPAAKVYLYTSAGTVLTDPLLTSAIRAVDDNLVSVLSLSYGSCEVSLGAGGNAAWAKLWQEAAAQGITGFVATGDSGSAGCDDFDEETFAFSGLAVNGLGSTPYNVAVGGTDMYLSSYAAAPSTLTAQLQSYWGAASTTAVASLLQAMPEQVWNDAFGLNTANGGVYDVNNSTILASGGGGSGAALYPATGVPTGYAKPVWQTGASVPADGVRDIPDISLFSGDGQNLVYYPICALAGDCVNVAAGGAVYITSVGGTSAATAAMAAIQSLVNQSTNSRQGQVNTVYYPLATKTLASTTKPFRDIVTGSNQVPCYQGTTSCSLGTAGQTKGNYAESGYLATFAYDRATGLGSVDVANLIKNWSLLTYRPSTTTLSISPVTFPHGTAASIKATVTPSAGPGSTTGTVGLISNDTVAYANGLGTFPLVNGTATGSLYTLPGGTYQVMANYSGDSTFKGSVSAPVTVTVTPEADTLSTYGWVLNPTDSNLYPLQAGIYVPYGSELFLDAQPIGVTEASLGTGQTTPASGSVTFTDKIGTTIVRTGTAPINSTGVAEWAPGTLTIGVHTVSASYAGDASYAASTQASAAQVTVFRGATTMSVVPLTTNVRAGSSVTVDVVMASAYLPLVGALPTGNIGVTLGNQSQAVALKSWTYGVSGKPVQEAVVTFTNVPPGLLPLSTVYPGDANWAASSNLYGTVTALATKPAPAVVLTAPIASFVPTGIVTLAGTVTGTTALGPPTGNLYFTWEGGNFTTNGALVATGTASSAFTLTLPANEMAAGSNIFVGTYRGDANYSAQSSTPLTVTLNAPDFSLTTTTQEVPVKIGSTAVGSVSLTPVGVQSGPVAVTCSAPAGITCVPSYASFTISTGNVDAITFKAPAGTVAGTYPAVVTAIASGRVHTAEILVAAYN
jgi:hypothetical protein